MTPCCVAGNGTCRTTVRCTHGLYDGGLLTAATASVMNIELFKGSNVIDTVKFGASASEKGFLKGLVPTISSGVLTYPSLRVTNVVANTNKLTLKFTAGIIGVHGSTSNTTSEFRMRPFSIGFNWNATTDPTNFVAGASATHTLSTGVIITMYNGDSTTPITGHVKDADNVNVKVVLQTGGTNGTSHVNSNVTDVPDQTDVTITGLPSDNTCKFPDDTGKCTIDKNKILVSKHAGLYYRIEARDATFGNAYAKASNFFRLDPASLVIKDAAGTAFADGTFPKVIRVDGLVTRTFSSQRCVFVSVLCFEKLRPDRFLTTQHTGAEITRTL
jgi:hypothetical protein